MQARALRADEAEVWKTLRIEALTEYPLAFLTTLEEAKKQPLEMIAGRLSSGNSFGVFDEECVGIGALIPLPYAQTAHRIQIGAYFVRASAQGTGAADLLMEAMLARANALGCWQCELSVLETNERARRFYARHGFEVVGRTPNAVVVDGQGLDDLVCVRIAKP